jgi:hypothetical protein
VLSQARFCTRPLTRAPYFFPDLHPTTETDEQAATGSGEIRAAGIRYVAVKPAISMAPIGTVRNERPDPGNSDHWGTWKPRLWSSPASATAASKSA